MGEEKDESTFELNPGGCVGFLVGAGVSALLALLFFQWFPMPGKPRGVGSFILLPFLIPLAVGWPLGAYLWKLCFPSFSAKANEQLVSCSCLVLFFIASVGGLALLLFGGDVIERINDWLSQNELVE